jgi:hypothetical protein
MKHILSFFALILAATALKAQVSFSPSVFTAIDRVTINVDVTGTPMAGQSEAFIWIFANLNPAGAVDGTVNGQWGNSSPAAKVTSLGGNRWSFSFTGTELFGKTPAELKEFGFLLKSKDGSRQTQDYKFYKFDPLIFTPTLMRVFPAKVGPDDAIRVNFDQSLATTVNDQRMVPRTVTVTLFNQADAVVGTPRDFNVKKDGTSIFYGTFIPTYSFTIPAGTNLKKFTYRFNGTVKDANGNDQTVSTEVTEVLFSQLK